MAGRTISTSVGGKQVAQVTDSTFSKGMAGLGSGWHPAWFRSFAVSPTAQPTTPVKSDDDNSAVAFDHPAGWQVSASMHV
jgi:hypothetical protein